MVRLAAVLSGLAAALGTSSALGAAEEAVPGGPPACSAVTSHEFPGRPWRVDLWIQCNYEVSTLTVKSPNRRLKTVSASPELLGARPTDAMGCRLNGSGAISCKGRVKPLGRVHMNMHVNEAACNPPRMRMSVLTSGGPGCEPGEICPAVGFTNTTPTPTDRRSMGCFGH